MRLCDECKRPIKSNYRLCYECNGKHVRLMGTMKYFNDFGRDPLEEVEKGQECFRCGKPYGTTLRFGKYICSRCWINQQPKVRGKNGR